MEEEGSKNIVIDLDILLRGSVSIYEENEILIDAYSIDNEVDTKTASIVTENNLLCKMVSQTINANVANEKDKIKEILASSPPIASNITFCNDFGLFAEGIINTEIIYINDKDTLCSIKIEVPFQILVDKDFPASGVLFSSLTVINTTISSINGNEISLTFESALSVKGASYEKTTYIEDIEKKNPKEDNNVAISLYIAKEGESLWDIAKSLSTDETTLLNLNPDIKLPLKSGEKILLYRELKF
ncbi:MAG: LysM peptidoglycan-binding domain-containing protein, partial [Bacillota bacterium]